MLSPELRKDLRYSTSEATDQAVLLKGEYVTHAPGGRHDGSLV